VFTSRASEESEDPDAPDARLVAQVLDDVVERLPVVVQHGVTRAAQDHIRHAVGGLHDKGLRVRALHPQVDEAE